MVKSLFLRYCSNLQSIFETFRNNIVLGLPVANKEHMQFVSCTFL